MHIFINNNMRILGAIGNQCAKRQTVTIPINKDKTKKDEHKNEALISNRYPLYNQFAGI